MSNARVKAERSKVKDIRQGIEEQRPVQSKSRKGAKPYRLVGDFYVWQNYVFGKYKTLAQAEQALITLQRRSNHSNMRIVSDDLED